MAISSQSSAPDPIRDRIQMLRFALIVMIVFVHIPYDDATSPYRDGAGPAGWAVLWIRDGLGRLGVPILSVISGYLAARSTKMIPAMLTEKVRTLLVPFLVFGVPVAALVAILQLNGSGSYWPRFVDGGLLAWADAFFALTERPVNQPLYFLRDLMLCFLLLPALRIATAQHPKLIIVVLAVLVVSGLLSPLFLAPQIILSFALGLALGQHGFATEGRFAMGWWAMPVLLVLAVVQAALRSFDPGPTAEMAIDAAMLAVTLIAAMACWSLSGSMYGSRTGAWLAKMGGYSFLLFLTHQPISVVAFAAWQKTGLPYLAFYLAIPVLCTALAYWGQKYAVKIAPGLFGWMTGKRAKTIRPAGSNPAG